MPTDPSKPPGTDRAPWLLQLSEALDEVHALLGSLADDCIHRASELDLFNQLAAVRGQLYQLRRERAGNQTPPERTIPPPWPIGNRDRG